VYTVINLRVSYNAGNFLTSEELLAFQEGMRFVELVVSYS